MRISENFEIKKTQTESKALAEFSAMINLNEINFLAKCKYNHLLTLIMELAEYKNYSDAQYYLARHFLQIGSINNYKFWLMRAASNVDPHPLANLKLVKFCLEKYHELLLNGSCQAEAYLNKARKHLQLIKNFTLAEHYQRFDWLYVKAQADILWRKEFEDHMATMPISPAPVNCNLVTERKADYFNELAQQAKKLSAKIKALLVKLNSDH